MVCPDDIDRTRRRLCAWVAGMCAWLVAYGAWQLLRWPQGHRVLIGDFSFYPVSLAAILTAWRASRRCAPNSRLRSAWRLLSLGAGAYFLGDIAQTFYELAGQKPYPSVADGFYLLFYPLMLAGLLRLSPGRQDLTAKVRLALDMTTVAVGGSLAVIYVVLGPTVVQGGADPVQTGFSIAYPAGDMVLLVGVASVMLRETLASSAHALRFLVGGLLFYVSGDLAYGYITLHGTYHGGDHVDALWMAGIAIFAIAGAAQQRSEPATDAVRERSNRQASWAPFVAVAVGFGLLLFDDRHDHWLPSLTLAVGAMLLVTLVSVRQFLAQRDLLRAQGALTYQSMHDALTGLPNRALVIDRASQMLARVRRHARASATLYVDLDGFKNVNDSFGHAAGDELLRVVAQRLREGVREADTVGRIGGDEFVVLLEELEAGESAHAVAERIRTRLAEPVDLTPTAGRILSVTASVGIATGARASADELLRDADLALYEAKAAGKNRVVTFESRMQATAQGRLELELDLKEAIARDELYLLYQPIFELESETMMSVEALVRWRHPERGIVPPNHFIPAAEQSSLIVPIGRWVLETACRQVAEWHSRGYGLGVAVNVSGRQLDDDGLVEHVAGVLAETGLDPHALTLEITETALMQDAAMATRRLNELKALGVRLAIDDFGTGYSSLAYLRQFPLDTLKIDRSFVSGIDSSAECRALIRTLVQLARALGLDTLGEGIEEHSQLHHLQREECDYGQGFLFARPSEPQGIEQFLARSLSSAA